MFPIFAEEVFEACWNRGKNEHPVSGRRNGLKKWFTTDLYSAMSNDVFDRHETDENSTLHKLCGCVAVEIGLLTGALMTLCC